MSFPLFVFQGLFRIRQRIPSILLIGLCGLSMLTNAQQNVAFGKGKITNVTVSSSSNASNQTGIQTLMSSGYLPNKNAAARLLSQATLGTTYADIENVATNGIEKWVDQQLAMPNSFVITPYMQNLHQGLADSMKRTDPTKNIGNTFLADRYFDISWFQGYMTATDLLRWRVALGLSEIFVTSRISANEGYPYASSSYYDMLLENSFTNYRNIIEKVTYHPSMAVYLTFMNNHATDSYNGKQTFPDENYARELMQLFSIGLFQLNLDGTEKKDANGKSIPTYNNNDIGGLAKVFTGLSWGDSRYLGDKLKDNWSYTKKLKFYAIDSSDYYLRPNASNKRITNGHEVGAKTFLGSTIPARSVEQGELDIKDALDIIFNHPNVGPFISRRLIQRLVTSNPSPAYIQRIATVFNNNGNNVRGDMKAVIRAILLDQEARDCCNNGNTEFAGALKEPFIRYTNLVKGLNLTATGGVFRNTMQRVYDKMGQLPMYSPSVFNFFSPDYLPDGALKGTGKFGPEFQTLNSQSLSGYMNALNSWLINDDPVEYLTYFPGETFKPNQDAKFDLSADYQLTRNDRLTQLLDKYNLILAHGRISQQSLNTIRNALSGMPLTVTNGVVNDSEANRIVRIAIYLIMSSPDYIINK
ncbi:DUF1800 family protein [Emticicia sp. C21]|uniref:DUF1800 domain-containing protein n=1 Tax=Emticicia sp. C21 TaxID=2302915 RepID=UPI000E352153|nr:DUF1800 family protein [Emticicia sp. C21]RFS17219.1 DUF1800 domain-containing protein [Emticicia sp. C21]